MTLDYRQKAVADFMIKGLQWDGEAILSSPNPRDEEELSTYKLRLKLCIEETFELFEAMLTSEAYEPFSEILQRTNAAIDQLSLEQLSVDPVAVFDSLVDQDYVNVGFANLLGLNLKEGFEEVHDSNLSKFGPEGKPTFREDGKLLKDLRTYREPDLEKVYKKNLNK